MTTPELHYLLGKRICEHREGARREGAVAPLDRVQARRPHLRRGRAGRVDLPQHREAQAPPGRVVQARDRRERRRLRDGRDAAPLLLHAEAARWRCGSSAAGVPKNYTLQGEPLLDQILGVPTHGFDIDVQLCVDPVDNGALSSCPAGEGHTWGKVSAESVATGSVYVHADVTAVFPWLTYALLSDPKMKRKHAAPLRRAGGRRRDAAARGRQAPQDAGQDHRLPAAGDEAEATVGLGLGGAAVEGPRAALEAPRAAVGLDRWPVGAPWPPVEPPGPPVGLDRWPVGAPWPPVGLDRWPVRAPWPPVGPPWPSVGPPRPPNRPP